MTTQSVQIQTYDYGASLSPVTLHNITTDAVAATADTCAEISADSGVYTAVFGGTAVIAAGVYRIRAVVSGAPVNRFVTLTGVDGEVAFARSERAVELDPAYDAAKTAATQSSVDAVAAAVAAAILTMNVQVEAY